MIIRNNPSNSSRFEFDFSISLLNRQRAFQKFQPGTHSFGREKVMLF